MTTLVLGATGTTGALLATALTSGGHTVRTASRTPGAADVVFDWANPAGHAAVLDGAHGVYLILPAAVADPEPQVLPFLKQAGRAGVRRITLVGTSAVPLGAPGLGVVAARLADFVPRWALLQPSWFASNFTGGHAHAASVRAADEIVSATGDGRVPFISPADIAAVAAHTLTAPQAPNRAMLLTGPQPLTFDEIASQLTIFTGRRIRHRRVTGSELADRWEVFGLARPFAELLAGMDGAIAKGAENRVSSIVEDLTGRPPRSFSEFLSTVPEGALDPPPSA